MFEVILKYINAFALKTLILQFGMKRLPTDQRTYQQNQSTNQPTNQPNNQPTNQPTSLLTN